MAGFAQGFADLANNGTVPGPNLASVLAGIGEADSNAAAAEAGLYAAPPAPLTPAQQVAQDFAALARDGGGSGITFAPGGRVLSFGAQTTAGLTVTIPLSWSALAGIGEADSNAAAAEAGLYAAPPPAPAQLTPAQRIDQGFSTVSANDPASIVQQDFVALGASGAGAGTGAGVSTPCWASSRRGRSPASRQPCRTSAT